ncbi:hypothetical protein ABT300_34530 [Streptomyces sp. NPDC001027]|uniref:hypothetical protein n=1 Tax=Streptomyces sp. NPDC001027 TaxID=3154771 RepID=UPI00331DE468
MSLWNKTASLWDKTKRARAIGGAVAAIAGSGQAPPPANMPAYLRQQYAKYGKVRDEQLARDIKRLTTQTRQPTTALGRRASRNLRGTK